ncbi:DNA polymerase III subunit gamma/tau domain-containing protein [Salinifilum ghardaiensis]
MSHRDQETPGRCRRALARGAVAAGAVFAGSLLAWLVGSGSPVSAEQLSRPAPPADTVTDRTVADHAEAVVRTASAALGPDAAEGSAPGAPGADRTTGAGTAEPTTAPAGPGAGQSETTHSGTAPGPGEGQRETAQPEIAQLEAVRPEAVQPAAEPAPDRAAPQSEPAPVVAPSAEHMTESPGAASTGAATGPSESAQPGPAHAEVAPAEAAPVEAVPAEAAPAEAATRSGPVRGLTDVVAETDLTGDQGLLGRSALPLAQELLDGPQGLLDDRGAVGALLAPVEGALHPPRPAEAASPQLAPVPPQRTVPAAEAPREAPSARASAVQQAPTGTAQPLVHAAPAQRTAAGDAVVPRQAPPQQQDRNAPAPLPAPAPPAPVGSADATPPLAPAFLARNTAVPGSDAGARPTARRGAPGPHGAPAPQPGTTPD